MSKDSWGEIDIAIGQCEDTQKWFLSVLYDLLPEWFLVPKTPALTGPWNYRSSASPKTLGVPQDTKRAEK